MAEGRSETIAELEVLYPTRQMSQIYTFEFTGKVNSDMRQLPKYVHFCGILFNAL